MQWKHRDFRLLSCENYKSEERRRIGKWLSTRRPLITMYPFDRKRQVVLFCSAFSLPCELVLLWSAICSLVAKACGRALMLSVCAPHQGGRCVYGLVLNAFLGLCLHNSFICTLKLNYTLSILLHVMQPSSTQIKHRCSEITFLTLPWYYLTCQLEVRILHVSQKLHGYFRLGSL